MAISAASTMHLTSKFQIGSCKGRMDYEVNERVFHQADVPQEAKNAKKWVKDSVRSHMLDTNPPFTLSTHTGKYVSATRPAGWDQNKFEDRYYATQETEERLKVEEAYKQSLIYQQDDPKAIQPLWNQATVFGARRCPPEDMYFHHHPNFALDGSKSLRMGGECFTSTQNVPASDGKMTTITGATQLGTGQPLVTDFNPNDIATSKKKGGKTHLPIDYISLVERANNESTRMRAHKTQQRLANEVTQQLQRDIGSSNVFDFPDVPNFAGTKRPDPVEIEKLVNDTYTADSLTKYLETMELANNEFAQTQLVQTRQIKARTNKAVGAAR